MGSASFHRSRGRLQASRSGGWRVHSFSQKGRRARWGNFARCGIVPRLYGGSVGGGGGERARSRGVRHPLSRTDRSPGRCRGTWPRSEHLDSDDRGPIPAVNVSVKISALFSQIKAEAPDDSIEQLCERLRPLLRLAKARNVFINFDMEMHSLKDLTLRLFKALLDEEEFNDYPHAGIAMQAYLRDTPDDLEQLIEWAAKRRTRVTVRLVKGAYWDTETILARQRRWPVPVYEHKQETDAAYERLARRLLENSEVIDCAFGTHNVRTIAACLAEAEQLGLPPRRLEFQMLYGMAEPIKEALSGMGYRVREYCPLGRDAARHGLPRATFAREHFQ